MNSGRSSTPAPVLTELITKDVIATHIQSQIDKDIDISAWGFRKGYQRMANIPTWDEVNPAYGILDLGLIDRKVHFIPPAGPKREGKILGFRFMMGIGNVSIVVIGTNGTFSAPGDSGAALRIEETHISELNSKSYTIPEDSIIGYITAGYDTSPNARVNADINTKAQITNKNEKEEISQTELNTNNNNVLFDKKSFALSIIPLSGPVGVLALLQEKPFDLMRIKGKDDLVLEELSKYPSLSNWNDLKRIEITGLK